MEGPLVNFGRRIISLAAAAVVVAGTVALSAPVANAETLHLKHSKTVKIVPAALAPASSRVTKAVITVKKGSKTVAKNKTSYKAKKGKYKVTTTVTFQQRRTVTASATDIWASCRIATMALTSDRTDWNDWFDGTGYYAGQVTFTYTGTCSETIYAADGSHFVQWKTSWQADDYIMTEFVSPSASRTDAIIAEASYGLGDSDYVDGTDMKTLPTYQTWSPSRTVKATRTVTVKR